MSERGFSKVLIYVLNEVLSEEAREGLEKTPSSRWLRGEESRSRRGRRSRQRQAVPTCTGHVSWRPLVADNQQAAGSAIWSLAHSVNFCFVLSTSDISPLQLSHSATICFSKPCSLLAPLVSLSGWFQSLALTSLAVP